LLLAGVCTDALTPVLYALMPSDAPLALVLPLEPLELGLPAAPLGPLFPLTLFEILKSSG